MSIDLGKAFLTTIPLGHAYPEHHNSKYTHIALKFGIFALNCEAVIQFNP
jgi:hypothetical protein